MWRHLHEFQAHADSATRTRVAVRQGSGNARGRHYIVEAASNPCIVEPSELPAAVPVAGDGPSFHTVLQSPRSTSRTPDPGFP
jgi:hypothetical protein